MENALIELVDNFEAVMADGISGKEPFLNASLMREAAKAKAEELESLPQFDLSTEAGRKQLRAAIKPVKQVFADFEKNIKVVKKMYLEIPKMCDASSKAVRDVAEPAIETVETPFRELKAQEALTEKWWKKEGIPFDKYSLERLLQETIDAQPLPYSAESEEADFHLRKGDYIKALQESLSRLFLAEKAEKEEKERLRLQAEEQRRVAEEQRREREALEAEQRRVAGESARLEAERAEIDKQRAAANPASAAPAKGTGDICAGAPSAASISDWERDAMTYEAETALLEVFESENIPEALVVSERTIAAVIEGRIPHVRFVYE